MVGRNSRAKRKIEKVGRPGCEVSADTVSDSVPGVIAKAQTYQIGYGVKGLMHSMADRIGFLDRTVRVARDMLTRRDEFSG